MFILAVNKLTDRLQTELQKLRMHLLVLLAAPPRNLRSEKVTCSRQLTILGTNAN